MKTAHVNDIDVRFELTDKGSRCCWSTVPISGVEAVDFHRTSKITLTVGSTNPSSRVEVRLDSPSGTKIAELSFEDTDVSSYVIPATTAAGEILVKEMAYKEVTVSLQRPVQAQLTLAPSFRDRRLGHLPPREAQEACR